MDPLPRLDSMLSEYQDHFKYKQGYLVLGFLSILDEKSRFGDRSYSGES